MSRFKWMVGWCGLAIASVASPVAGQSAGAGRAAPRVAVFNVALYTAGANVQEASDSGKAALATQTLRAVLRDSLGDALVDSAAVARAAAAPENERITGGKGCNVIVSCVKEVGGRLGASWAVMAKVSKTSNLIWLLTGQLIDLRSGKILLDDSTELKGDPGPMIRTGVRIFADRVARAVRQGAPSS
jgi:hypothetical protein